MLQRKLIRTAWNYKAQFISMIITVAIGIGVFLGFNIEWHSIESNTSSFFDSTAYADYRIYSENGFSAEDATAVSEISGIDAATRYLSVSVGIKDTEKTVTLNVSENYNVSTMLVTSGEKYKSDSEGIWLSDRFAEENGISLGDSITLTYKTAEISGEIVGLCKSSENMICVADENQIMPDYTAHGFAYISPKALEKALGTAFYPQINIISDMEKRSIETAVKDKLGKTLLITDKTLHTAYAGAKSEAEEGKTMGAVLPVLFLAIAILTMVTTMHRIAQGEKVQIGTLKALGFRDGKILLHYSSYGFLTGVLGTVLGVALGYGIAALVMSPSGMMSTYFDLPEWRLTMPAFCIPVILLTPILLTLINLFSVRKMQKGTVAETLRPYTPKIKSGARRKSGKTATRLPFSVKWNIRDIKRHKARSAMTLFGIFGCMLLIVGGLGMRDTMNLFLETIDTTADYTVKLNIAETADKSSVLALCSDLCGDWQASMGISLDGETVTLDIYKSGTEKIRFSDKNNNIFFLSDDGVYLCLRLKDTAKIGDTVTFSPYGSDKTYTARVAGYFRSSVTKSIAVSEKYADSLGMDYKITSLYTDKPTEEIPVSETVSGKQDKNAVMESYETFSELMDLMVAILIVAAVILGTVVLYNLGIMSYIERKRELATLKVLGFRDKKITHLFVSQNLWLTLAGIIIGLPGGTGVLYILIKALCGEYELKLTISGFTVFASVLLTLGVSLLVGAAVAGKNRKIDMVESLKYTD